MLLLCEADKESAQRRRPRDDLKSYYGMVADGSAGATAGGTAAGPCDINGANFEPDVYLAKLLKERSLTELMDKETEMVRNIKTLDSDMQTLVYENYNKFISATDTIRKVLKITIYIQSYLLVGQSRDGQIP